MPLIIGALIGAGASIGGSAIQAAASKKIAKAQIKAAKTMEEGRAIERTALGQKAESAREIAEEQRARTETARVGLFTSLGAPGTYGPEAAGQYGQSGMGAPSGLSGLYGLETREGQVSAEDIGGTLSKRISDWKTTGQMLDVDKFLQTAKSSASFRTVSKMVAESEQLLSRSGPLWDGMYNSVMGGIMEGAASQQREMMDQISRDMARSGTARRQGLATVQKMQAIEAVNRQRVQATWQASLALEQWVRQYAANTQNFAQGWVNNHDGVRDQFSSAMTELTNFWTTSTMPIMMQASSADYRTSAAMLQPIMSAQRESASAFSQALSLGISGVGNLIGSKIGGWLEGGPSPTSQPMGGGWSIDQGNIGTTAGGQSSGWNINRG